MGRKGGRRGRSKARSKARSRSKARRRSHNLGGGIRIGISARSNHSSSSHRRRRGFGGFRRGGGGGGVSGANCGCVCPCIFGGFIFIVGLIVFLIGELSDPFWGPDDPQDFRDSEEKRLSSMRTAGSVLMPIGALAILSACICWRCSGGAPEGGDQGADGAAQDETVANTIGPGAMELGAVPGGGEDGGIHYAGGIPCSVCHNDSPPGSIMCVACGGKLVQPPAGSQPYAVQYGNAPYVQPAVPHLQADAPPAGAVFGYPAAPPAAAGQYAQPPAPMYGHPVAGAPLPASAPQYAQQPYAAAAPSYPSAPAPAPASVYVPMAQVIAQPSAPPASAKPAPPMPEEDANFAGGPPPPPSYHEANQI